MAKEGLAAGRGPCLFLSGRCAVPLVPGGDLAEVLWFEGGAAWFLEMSGEGYPVAGGGRGGAGESLWSVGSLDGADVLCYRPGGQAGVVGAPAVFCYLCGTPLVGHATTLFLCLCGAGLLVGVGVVHDSDPDDGSTGIRPACVDADVDIGRAGTVLVQDADVGIGAASTVLFQDADIGIGRAGTASVGIGGDADLGMGGAASATGSGDERPAAVARPVVHGQGGVRGGRRARERAGRAPAPAQTPQGEGRRSRRREAQSRASYKAPAAAAEEAGEEELAVQAPEAAGVNQGTPVVSALNDDLEVAYTEMASHSRAIERLVTTQRALRRDADGARDWTAVGERLRPLESRVDQLLSRYDWLSEEATRLRSTIRGAGGCPVEPPRILAVHPRTHTCKK